MQFACAGKMHRLSASHQNDRPCGARIKPLNKKLFEFPQDFARQTVALRFPFKP